MIEFAAWTEVDDRPLEEGFFAAPRFPGSDSCYRLRVLRIRGRTHVAPPIVFLAGGPGETAENALAFQPFWDAMWAAAEVGDVLILDQRGQGGSEPSLPRAPMEWPADLLVNPMVAMAALRDHAAASRKLWDPEIEPRTLTPWHSAHDLVALADALEEPQMDLWGYSYGTHLTMAALRLAPHRFRRVVLCGFEGPDQTLKRPRHIQTQLERLDARFPGLLGDMEAVHQELEESPVVLNDATRLGAFGLRWMVGSWVGLANRFGKMPEVYASLRRGDTSAATKAAQGFRLMLKRRASTFWLMDAASGVSESRLREIRDEAPSCLLRDAFNFPFPEIGAAWGQVPLPESFRGPLTYDGPTLCVTGGLDGFTPGANVIEAGMGFTQLTHRDLPGLAHDQLLTWDGAGSTIRDWRMGFSQSGNGPEV
jgi:pimeloyl-ACP methyl ester carboxylesterase